MQNEKMVVLNQKYLHMYSTCFFVKGYKNGILIDLQRSNMINVPNSLIEFVKECQRLTINEVLIKYENYTNVIHEYIDFLISRQYAIFITKTEKKYFPTMSSYWDFPSEISNSIIECTDNTNYLLKYYIAQICSLNCYHLLIKLFDSITKDDLLELVETIDNTNIKSACIYINNNTIDFNSTEVIQAIDKKGNLKEIILYKSIHNLIKGVYKNILIEDVDYLMSKEICGVIDQLYFSVYFPHFTESQKHNTCLNRKICIDADGEIRNCPAMKKSYGNIKDTTLKEAMEKPGFKDLWFICKDQIDVCKDCEFRHMCTDCRAFIKDPDNIYSQPAKCTYNPYIAKWQGEEGYVPVEECGTYTKEKGFVVNKRKVNKLNKILWGE